MAAVAMVATWRVRPGRLQDFMAVLGRAKKIHTRLQCKVRVWSTQFGAEPLTIGYAVELADARAFGEYATKIETDPEWLALVTEFSANRDPVADLVHQGLATELPVVRPALKAIRFERGTGRFSPFVGAPTGRSRGARDGAREESSLSAFHLSVFAPAQNRGKYHERAGYA